jgi:hypothetical protein
MPADLYADLVGLLLAGIGALLAVGLVLILLIPRQ